MIRLGLFLLGLSLGLAGCGGGSGSIADSDPPVINQVNIERSSNRVVVSATVQDSSSGVAAVQVVATVGTTQQTVPMAAEPTTRYRASLPLNTTRFAIQAVDNAGNSRQSDEFLVPPPEPPF